jgi:hypothetical protein
MKIRILSLFAGILLTQAAMAQIDLGIKAGANITKVEGRSFKDEFRYGYLLGGFAEISLGKKLSIQPEVIFNQFQTRTDTAFKAIYQNAFNSATNGDVKLNYLSIPVLLNYKLGSALSVQAGPQFGILLDQDKNLLQNGENAFRSGDLSLLGGATLKLGKIRLNGRYAVGLNNINDIDNRDEWKSQAWQLSLGYAF